MKKSNVVFIVVELGGQVPVILGVYSTRKAAETVAYSKNNVWCNIIEKPVQ